MNLCVNYLVTMLVLGMQYCQNASVKQIVEASLAVAPARVPSTAPSPGPRAQLAIPVGLGSCAQEKIVHRRRLAMHM